MECTDYQCQQSPCKRFGFVMIIIAKTNIIIPIWTSYCMPRIPHNKISQTSPKQYNEFRSVKNEALIWLQMTAKTGMKNQNLHTKKERISTTTAIDYH